MRHETFVLSRVYTGNDNARNRSAILGRQYGQGNNLTRILISPNIEKFFNLDGIIVFDTIEDLKKIVDKVNRNDYNVPHEIVLDNYRRALQYCYNNDRFFDKYLRKMLTNLPKKDWSI